MATSEELRIAAIRAELQEQISRLQGENQNLRNENRRLSTRVQQLEPEVEKLLAMRGAFQRAVG